MIKVGDILEGYEVVYINEDGDQATLRDQRTDYINVWNVYGNKLTSVTEYEVDTIHLTPKPVYDGAFGESVELEFDEGRFIAPFDICNVSSSVADALNCLQIDLRKNSVEPVDDVDQWSLTLDDGNLYAFSSYDLDNKLEHALPWYATREEAEKHLTDSVRVIKSLKEIKGISK